MAQFEVHRVRGGALVVDCQANELNSLATRFVIPLVPGDQKFPANRRLAPVFEVDQQAFMLMPPLARTIHLRDIESTVTSLEADRYVIQGAIDVLTGSG